MPRLAESEKPLGHFMDPEKPLAHYTLRWSTQAVAEAAGGFLGLTWKVSKAERKVLQEIDALLD